MSQSSIPNKIISWNINTYFADGTSETIIDIPDDIASMIDDYLSEVEQDILQERASKYGDKYINKQGV